MNRDTWQAESDELSVAVDAKAGKRRIWIAVALLLAIVAALLSLGWCTMRSEGDTGVRIYPQGSMSSAEAQQMLDEQTEKSRITVSLSPSMRLRADGSLRVNFMVEEPNNGFSERLEVEQGGRIVYASGSVAPGYAIEWCRAPGARPGSATATVYALDENGNDRGNPISVEVDIVEEPSA